MIQELYIIDVSGVCVFYQDMSGTNTLKKQDIMNPQLISGFFSAIMAFAENSEDVVSEDASPVNNITLQNSAYFFHKKESYYFVLKCDTVNIEKMERVYIKVLENIARVFEDYVQRGELELSNFKTIDNEDFARDIRDVISKTIRKSLLGL